MWRLLSIWYGCGCAWARAARRLAATLEGAMALTFAGLAAVAVAAACVVTLGGWLADGILAVGDC